MDRKEAAMALEDDLVHIADMAERASVMLEEVLDERYFCCGPVDSSLRDAYKSASVKIDVAREAANDMLAALDRLFSDE